MFVEDIAHDTPGEVVQWRGRRDLTATTEDEWRGQVLEWQAGEHAGKNVEQDWGQNAREPEVLEVGVETSG